MIFFTNIASVIPIEEKEDHLEEKALVYRKGIKEALGCRFQCLIRLMASWNIPERFGVPLVDDWIDNIGLINVHMHYFQIKIFS